MYEYKIQINRCMNKAKSDAGKWFDWLTVDWQFIDGQVYLHLMIQRVFKFELYSGIGNYIACGF